VAISHENPFSTSALTFALARLSCLYKLLN